MKIFTNLDLYGVFCSYCIFSLSTNDHSFKIIKMLPIEVVSCSDMTTLSEAGLSSPSTLTVTVEEEEDVLAHFQVSVTEENRVYMKLYSVNIDFLVLIPYSRLSRELYSRVSRNSQH